MALKLTAILLMVVFAVMQFGGTQRPSGPFAEAPGAGPGVTPVEVTPLGAPLRAAVFTEPAPALQVTRAAATPEPVPAVAAADDEPAPEVPDLDLVVIDPQALRNSLGDDATTPATPITGPAGAPAPAGIFATVTASAVNLRAGPSTSDAIEGRAARDDRVEFLGNPSPGWAMIRHPDVAEPVYMAARYLEIERQ